MTENATTDKGAIEVTMDELRADLPGAINRAGFGRERLVITRNGRQIASLVPMRDLERLKQLDAA